MEGSERTVYFDYLRPVAVLAVIIIHLSAKNFESIDVNSSAWQTFNIFNSIARWSVPVFVMISGGGVSRQRNSCKKNILKICFASGALFCCLVRCLCGFFRRIYG